MLTSSIVLGMCAEVLARLFRRPSECCWSVCLRWFDMVVVVLGDGFGLSPSGFQFELVPWFGLVLLVVDFGLVGSMI